MNRETATKSSSGPSDAVIERRMERRQHQIAERIEEIRREKKLTQQALGDKAGWKVSFINGLLRGKIKMTLQTLCRLEVALDCEIICMSKDNDSISGRRTSSTTTSTAPTRIQDPHE